MPDTAEKAVMEENGESDLINTVVSVYVGYMRRWQGQREGNAKAREASSRTMSEWP